MKLVFRAVVLFLVCGSFSGAQEALKPADVDVAGLFELARARSAGVSTAKFAFTQTMSMMGQNMEAEGEGILKSPGKIRVVIRMSMPMGEMTTSVFSDGETMWQTVEMPMGLHVVRYDLATMDASAAAQVSGLGPWGTLDADRMQEIKNQMMLQFDLRVIGMEEGSGAPVYVVDAKPRAGGAPTGPMPVDRMQYRLGAADGFVRAMDVYDKAGNALISLSVQDLAFDVEAADSLFVYTPPPGVPVSDGNALMKAAQGEQPQAGLLNNEAPALALTDLDGKEVSLASLRGNVVLIEFWASWCRPCVEALPHIQKLHEELNEKGLVVLGINSEPAEVARRFVQDNGYTFRTLIDEGKTAWGPYNVQGIPTTLVVDREGIVRSYTMGYRPEADVRAALAQAGIE